MNRSNKGFISLCISLLGLLIIFNGCEDPGSVGGGFVDQSTLKFDTLSISTTQETSLNGYSGRLSYIPIGSYSDPVFGDIAVSAFMRPSLSPIIPDSVDLEDSFQVKLSLSIDSVLAYGDTLSETSFTVHDVTSSWRGRNIRVNDDIQVGNQIGSFSIGQEKKLVVDLDQAWVDDYKSYYNNTSANVDSSYTTDFKGLAIVPDGSNSKISYLPTALSGNSFLFISGFNSDTTDTVRVPIADFGYTLDRSGASNPTTSFPIYTTLESLLSVTIPDSILKADNANKNIIRAGLVFYENQELLTGSLPANNVRPEVPILGVHIKEDLEPVFNYQFSLPPFNGLREEGEPVFEIDITNYVNNVIFGSENRNDLVISISSQDNQTLRSQLLSTMIYNQNAPESVRPKLIITSLED